jgi:hypothetical protein
MLRRAGRGTFHLPNSEGSTGQRGPVTMPMAGMEEPATATQEAQMRKPPANPTEQKCPACNGTGYSVVMQPVRPGRKIYPAPRQKCGGEGRIP